MNTRTRFGAWIATIAGLVAVMLVTTVAWAWGATYYSAGNQDATVLANWWTNTNGTGSHPTNFTSGDVFVIQNGHSMTTSAAWTISGTGAKLQLSNGGTLTATFVVAVPAFQVDNGGTYVHNATSGSANGAAADVPGSTSRTFGATSTVEFQKWANGGGSPVALPSGVTWGNLKINVATLGGFWQQSGALTAVAGNLIIQATGGTTREFRLNANSPATSTLNLTGDLQISGGIFNVTSGTAVETFNIGGNFNQSGGTFTATGTGPHAVNFTGGGSSATFSSSNGTFTITNIDWQIAAGKTLTLNNNFTLPASRTMTVASTGTLTAAVTLTNSGTLTVNGTLQIDPSGSVAGTAPTYSGSSTLVYNAGATVGTEWNGTGGTAGAGVPQNVTIQAGVVIQPGSARTVPGNLTISGGRDSLSTGGDLTVKGTLALGSSKLGTGTAKVILPTGASLTRTGGGYISGNLQMAIPAGSSTPTFHIGDVSNYTPVALAFGSGTTAGNLTASTTAATHPNLGSSQISGTKYVKRYWTFTNSGVSSTYDATFNFVSGDIQGSANTNNFKVGKYDAGWTYPTVGTKGSTTPRPRG